MKENWIKKSLDYASKILENRINRNPNDIYKSYNGTKKFTVSGLIYKYGKPKFEPKIEEWIVRPLVYKEPMLMIFTDSDGVKYWYDKGAWKDYSEYLKNILRTEFLSPKMKYKRK